MKMGLPASCAHSSVGRNEMLRAFRQQHTVDLRSGMVRRVCDIVLLHIMDERGRQPSEKGEVLLRGVGTLHYLSTTSICSVAACLLNMSWPDHNGTHGIIT